MSKPNLHIKKRIIFLMFLFFAFMVALIVRLGQFQLIDGDVYKKEAFEQWSRDISINASRGTIYDKKGKRLAVSVKSDTVVCFPRDITKSINKSNQEVPVEIVEDKGVMYKILNIFKAEEETVEDDAIDKEAVQAEIENEYNEIAVKLSEVLEMEKDEVYSLITKDSEYVTIKRWITIEQADKLEEMDIVGIKIIEDTKRVYPYGNFASYILGFTNIDQVGLYGIEKTYNEYLMGEPGRRIVNTDSNGVELPYDGFEEYFEPVDGLNVVLTIDEVIQHYAENAVEKAYYDNRAKSATMLIMDPETGDVLAMASKPSYDPNNPREPYDETMEKLWEGLNDNELTEKWYDLWRNPSVNDIYEPGSTFKLLTGAIALEENKASLDTKYYCDGYVTGIESATTIKCWRYYNPHGEQTFAETLQNSCNDALADMGLAIGKERFRHYIDALGFGEKTNIELNGEAYGLVNEPANMKDVNTVTQSFGQGISVTPIQLVTALCSLCNDGYLVKPRIVKQLVDNDGNIVKENEVEIVRRVFSEETCNDMLYAMESVVSEGSGRNAYIPGYSVGGKTGTAQKVIGGKYSEDMYITSFIAAAPTYDPEVVALMIIDEPKDSYYGSTIAAPVIGDVLEEVLNYMDVPPVYTDEEKVKIENSYVIVPNVTGMNIKDASGLLEKLGLEHNVTINVDEEMVVKEQYPKEGTEVMRGSVITIMLN
ncbi:stage V sporulation protein D (sporulation-specific penicillin-binding protein) [Dethiosulfatibacter aminovorans DSM 17477]|uniref:Stage V sporulation protein D (Sporulation-specific penicillin-binding protein) n=1 Tax=Dethiosulfatibacter aminovorans DSM 17477 TaxID=1121476 RepID=A0A1M6DLR6_9FIRM|nr:stage V sporulation protein D (sporulation-specific penicillin-binding protein) [Dethiosulfatibacter aminovorans DSM 17477]